MISDRGATRHYDNCRWVGMWGVQYTCTDACPPPPHPPPWQFGLLVQGDYTPLHISACWCRVTTPPYTSLHAGAGCLYSPTYRCMLAQGDYTPLHIAAYNGHVEVVRILLGAGSNKEAANSVSHPSASSIPT